MPSLPNPLNCVTVRCTVEAHAASTYTLLVPHQQPHRCLICHASQDAAARAENHKRSAAAEAPSATGTCSSTVITRQPVGSSIITSVQLPHLSQLVMLMIDCNCRTPGIGAASGGGGTVAAAATCLQGRQHRPPGGCPAGPGRPAAVRRHPLLSSCAGELRSGHPVCASLGETLLTTAAGSAPMHPGSCWLNAQNIS
jgi:hypothetical protein